MAISPLFGRMETAMKSIVISFRLSLVVTLCVLLLTPARVGAEIDPLSSGNEGTAKQAIIQFVKDTTDKAGPGRRFMGLVHHTDAEREWAYDLQSPIGRLDKALNEARKKGWLVVDMKRDWKVVFPFESKQTISR